MSNFCELFTFSCYLDKQTVESAKRGNRWQQHTAMSNLQCTECKRPTKLVHDHAAGDVLCTECGLVLEAHSVDETSEWRTFSNESSGADPARVGGPLNPLLSDGGLATMISNTGGSADLPGRRGWASQATDPNRELNAAFSAIGDMAERWVPAAKP